jgi:hypothetical protein
LNGNVGIYILAYPIVLLTGMQLSRKLCSFRFELALPWEEGEQFVDPNYLYINETQRSRCEELLNRYFYSHEAIAYWMKVKNNISTTFPSHGDSEYINKFENAYEPIWIQRNLCNGLFDSEAWNDSEEWACKCFKCPQRAWFYFSMAVLADNFIEILSKGNDRKKSKPEYLKKAVNRTNSMIKAENEIIYAYSLMPQEMKNIEKSYWRLSLAARNIIAKSEKISSESMKFRTDYWHPFLKKERRLLYISKDELQSKLFWISPEQGLQAAEKSKQLTGTRNRDPKNRKLKGTRNRDPKESQT